MSVTPGNVHEVLNRWVLADGFPLVLDLEKSKGPYLHDSKSGKDYLDFFSFFAARPLGFNHPKLDDPAFIQRIGKIALHKPSNCDVYTVEYARFVDTFARVALGGEFAHVFFVEGGAPAVENAVKAAIDWKHKKNLATGKPDKGSTIISFKQGFHGRTGYAISLTDSHDPRKLQHFPRFPWPRVTNPKMRFPFDDQAKAEVEALEQKSLREIDALLGEHTDDVAAIIIEPIQGEGGDNYFRSEFLRALRKVCTERECLLIFDEIQTGFGATGKWWDWQHHGVKPDLMVFGKKTSVCGFAATARIDEIDGVFKVPSRISSTFEGNLVDMVRCERVIEIIQEDKLIDNVVTMGTFLLRLLHDQSREHPQITNVRGRGLFAAFDLPTTDERDRLVRTCFEEELIVLPCGVRSVRMRPALDIAADAVGRAGAQLEAGLRRAFPRAA
jgi:L-lysine 6-transaminase